MLVLIYVTKFCQFGVNEGEQARLAIAIYFMIGPSVKTEVAVSLDSMQWNSMGVPPLCLQLKGTELKTLPQQHV